MASVYDQWLLSFAGAGAAFILAGDSGCQTSLKFVIRWFGIICRRSVIVRHRRSSFGRHSTSDLATQNVTIHTPMAPMLAEQLSGRIALVPILRAGLGMLDPVLDLIPSAEVWHLGIYRDEATATPVEYYCKIPETSPVDIGIVLDPMLATGGSAATAIEVLKRWGIRSIRLLSVIAARDGIEAITTKYPDVSVYVCAVDSELNSRKFIVPGLGDAGDRIFNTVRNEN